MPGPLGRAKSGAAKNKKSDKGKGKLFNIDLPDVGIGKAITGLGKGVGALAYTLPLNTARGNFKPLSDFAHDFTSSFVGTGISAIDLATLGKGHGLTDPLRDQWGTLLGGEQYRPSSLSEQVERGGLLPTILENVGNVAIAGGAVGKLAGLGTVGRVAAADLAASKAASAGFSASRIAEAANAVRAGEAGLVRSAASKGLTEAGIRNPALRAAGKTAAKAEGLTADAASVAARTKLLNRADTAAHPYRSAYSKVIGPLGKAAQAAVVAEKAAPDGQRTYSYDALPAEEAAAKIAFQEVPEWATNTVAKLPKRAGDVLRKADRFVDARKASAVIKDRIRAQDIARREFMEGPTAKATNEVAQAHLVGKTLPDGTVITPEVADAILGDAIMTKNDLGSAVEDYVTKGATPEQRAAVRESLQNANVRSKSIIPDEWLTGPDGAPTALGKAVDDVAEMWRAEEPKRLEILRGTRVGDVGLEQAGDRVPQTGTKAKAKTALADKAIKAAIKLETKVIPKELDGLTKEASKLEGAITKIDEKIAAGKAVMERELQKLAESRQQSLDSMQRRKTIPWVDKFTGEVHDIDVPTPPTTPRQMMLPAPKLPGTDYAKYRSGVAGGTASTVYESAVKAERGLTSSKKALETKLAKLTADIDAGNVPSKNAADKLRKTAEKRLAQAAAADNVPKMKDVPPAWKPGWHALQTLKRDAQTNPHLAELLDDGIEATWDEMMRIAESNGFDPVHIRSFSPAEINQLVYESVRLGRRGRDLGQSMVAGTQKTRKVPTIRTRNFSALVAGLAEATHSLHTNALADGIEEMYARPIPDGDPALMPKGWVPWDPERSFLLAGDETPDGTTIAKGVPGSPTMMIPKEVKYVLDSYQKDYNHPVFKALRTAMDPVRLFLLTLSPKWYVNNFGGNVTAALKEGVNPFTDFKAAWESYRTGGPKNESNWFLRRFGAGKDSFADARGAVAGSVSSEGNRSTLIPFPQGSAGLKMAHGISFGTAVKLAQSRVGRMNEVVDELARVAVYKSHQRRGTPDAQALNRTYEALVDYNDLNPLERQVIRSIIPFYAWQKGVFKLVSKYPIDHPIGAGIAMQLANLQREVLEDELGGSVPDAYSALVKIPGLGWTNTRSLNPFQDAGQLASPQGIAASLNPFFESVVRNAMGAPEGGFADEYRVDDYGNVVPDTSPARDLTDIVTGLPQFRVGESLSGRSLSGVPTKTKPRAALQFGGLNTLTDEQVKKIVSRAEKSKKRLAR